MHLLRRLGDDAPEVGGVELDPDLVAELRVGIELVGALEADLGGLVLDLLHDLAELEEFDLAQLLVEARLDLLLEPELAPSRLDHRLLERANDHAAVDALVLGDLIDLALQSTQHLGSNRPAALAVGRPRARRRRRAAVY
jgi:hypothetical protein